MKGCVRREREWGGTVDGGEVTNDGLLAKVMHARVE